MHLTRIRRNGYLELKKDKYKGIHTLEKLPHKTVDNFILKNCKFMIDEKIALKLKEMGFNNATIWTVKYRRRKLGIKKYLYGEIKKHKAWIRAQALKKYGNLCELCFYPLSVDIHHIIPKYKGGKHEVGNLMVVCPNCHSLITRKTIKITTRKDISRVRRIIIKKIKDNHILVNLALTAGGMAH
jgi:5-methylcytosine-specific restriction endonuclease McrA